MFTPEWRPYLVFFINELGQSVYSPQDPRGSRFHRRNVFDFSATETSRQTFVREVEECFRSTQRSNTFQWEADYGDEVRVYDVDLHFITTHFVMVQLYRNEIAMADLTKTENLVLKHLCNDKTDKEIADILAVTTATIRSHVSNLKIKLNVDGRIKLGIEAYRLGLVKLRTRKEHKR